MSAVLFTALALGQAGCYVALAFLGNLRQHVPETIGIFAAAFLLYVLTLGLLVNDKKSARPAARTSEIKNSFKNRYLPAVLGLAILFRLILWPSAPSLSDDIYRYVWEGRAVSEGKNPFALAPDAPELAHLRDAVIYPFVSRKELTAIYPPLAQYIFAATATASYSVAAMKAVFIGFDLAVIGLLLLILAALGKNPLQAAIYGFNPLVIVEFAGSGHFDVAGIFFMMLALYFCQKRRPVSSAAALALAFLVKLLPALLLPALLRTRKPAAIALFSAISAAAFLPFVDAGPQLYTSLVMYGEHWMFNGSLYNLLLQIMADNQSARRVAAGLFCLAAAGAYYRFFKTNRSGQPGDIFSQCLFILGLLLLFTPVVHPWYVCWMVPLAAITFSRPWLLFSGLVFASYWILRGFAATGQWQESPFVLFIEYAPLYGLLLFEYVRTRGKNVHASHI